MTASLALEWTLIDMVGKTVKLDVFQHSQIIEFQNIPNRNSQNRSSPRIQRMVIILWEVLNEKNDEVLKVAVRGCSFNQ